MIEKDVSITVDGLKLSGQFFIPDDADPPYATVILCHGIPSGTVDPTDGGYPLLAQTIAAEGFAVLTFNFRGCRASEGNFDILGWTRDLEAVVEYIFDQLEVDSEHVFLVGFSAGAAVAIYIASLDKWITGVAACASPADFKAISEGDKPEYSLDSFRKIGIIRDPDFPPSIDEWKANFRKVNALDAVSNISPRSVIFIHSDRDPVVAVENSQKLYEAAGEPKQIVILKGEQHQLRKNELAVSTIMDWLKMHLVD